MVALAVPLLLLAAGADTAPVARALDAAAATRLVQAASARFACAQPAQVDEALADARSLGIACEDADAACWQRFLAAEGYARVVVAAPATGGGVSVWVVEGHGPVRTGTASDAVAALELALAPAAATPPTPEPAPAPADPPPAPAQDPGSVPPPAPGASSPSTALFVGAGVAAGVGVVSAGAATWVSVELSRALDDADKGRAPLEDYAGRNALFFALAGVSGLALATAVGCGVAAVLSGPADAGP